jgi:hypothetical protein
MSKEKWTNPEVEEFDITERTQFESLGGDDGPSRGRLNAGDADDGSGNSGSGSPSS